MSTHNIWPLGQIPKYLQRPELEMVRQRGYSWDDPFDVIQIFEDKVAKFAGSKYAISVDCCSHGLFLALKYLNASGNIVIPKHTYVSVPMTIKHAGCTPVLSDIDWQGCYQLGDYPVWDAAPQWKRDMYQDGFHVLSFQIKKPIPIGRGGMILTNDSDAARWLRKAAHDGRDMSELYMLDDFEFSGWHYYMTPEDAARGILLMDEIGQHDFPDRQGKESYIDLSGKTIFK